MTSNARTQCYDSFAVEFDRFQEALRSVTFSESSPLKQIFIKFIQTSAEMTEYEFLNRFIKVFKNQKHHFYGFLSFFDKMGSRFFSHQRAHKHTFTRPTKKCSRKGGKNPTNLGQKVNLSVYLAGFATLPCSKCRHLCTYSAHNCVLRFLSKFFEAIWISGQSSQWRTKRLICAHFP